MLEIGFQIAFLGEVEMLLKDLAGGSKGKVTPSPWFTRSGPRFRGSNSDSFSGCSLPIPGSPGTGSAPPT